MLSERIEKWSKELVEKGRARGLVEGENKGKAQGKAEGLLEGELKGKSEGKAEGKAELFLSLYEMKFGAVPQDMRSRIETADDGEILRMSERLLTAKSPEEVFPSNG